jgi:hypothetical protein
MNESIFKTGTTVIPVNETKKSPDGNTYILVLTPDGSPFIGELTGATYRYKTVLICDDGVGEIMKRDYKWAYWPDVVLALNA